MKYTSETRQVRCGQRVLNYTLTRKPVKNINLSIKPDGRILVSANKRVPVAYIDNLIKEKQEFIYRAFRKFEERQKHLSPLPLKYEDSESIKVLGKRLRLKVIEGKPESVTSDGEEIFLTVKKTDDARHKENMVNRWLKELQTDVFEQICMDTCEIFEKYGVKYPVIKIRKMKTRWGSCQPKKGVITLNSRLIEAPRKCIEYVVLHEFAHFIHPDHSKKFYNFIETLMPDWKERKKELETQAER